MAAAGKPQEAEARPDPRQRLQRGPKKECRMEVKNVPVPVNKLFDMGDPLARERANALIALQAGEIDYYEYSKKLEKIQRKQLLPGLEKAKIAGDWEGFINMALSIPELLKDAFKDFDKIPNQLKYDFAISAYTHHGDSIPAVRKAVRNALKYGRPTLPEYIRDKDIVTVYSIGDVSKELCGGPHVKNTREIGKFKIIKEEASSVGVRRIKAIIE